MAFGIGDAPGLVNDAQIGGHKAQAATAGA
jgi:hypothetical protein